MPVMSAPQSSSSTPQRGVSLTVTTFPDTSAKREREISSSPGTKGHETNLIEPAKGPVAALSTSKLANQAPKKIKFHHDLSEDSEAYPMDRLLAKLSEQQAVLNQQNRALKSTETGNCSTRLQQDVSTGNSLPATPATEGFTSTAPTSRPTSVKLDESSRQTEEEVLHLKLQLAHAQNHISKLDQELAHTRYDKPEVDAMDHGAFRGSAPVLRDSPWPAPEDARSDTSEKFAPTAFNRSRGIWGSSANLLPPAPPQSRTSAPSPSNWFGSRGYHAANTESNVSYSTVGGYREDRSSPDSDYFVRSGGRRNNRFDDRGNAPHQYTNGYNGYNNHTGYGSSTAQYDGMISGQMSAYPAPGGANANPPTHGLPSIATGMYPQYQHQPIGTPLSPHASEFMSKEGWKSELVSDVPTYLPPTEPLNYRRLLDRNVNCNWKYIVDKIVCNNDQQASIFLQQKLKVGTPEQKYEIVEAIVSQAYPLMVNRFGNFLVQRCFEHGTPEQVIKIAEGIRGNTLSLSMDPFGCHVVQKAFDSVPEDYKAIMVHELLRRIPETVIHRYACHVWQKLFELRWTESPPQIMKFVNEALRGMWHEVALGETGSLVVQNIFENCLEDDKRPCIEEVLANIDIVAHGQFGNWCIQHVCEHSAPPDRSRAIDHVIRYAAEYSTDQFASKVVEKCLKIGGTDFLGRYLDRVCEGRRDRTRIPLIDIASDQYGNYLIQWILNNAAPQHREMVAAHIRKHMVSLRGSKFGSRVGMLCTNHAVTTRPGPGAGPGMGAGRMGPTPRFNAGPAYR